MKWRTDEVTLEELMLSKKQSVEGDLESLARLLVLRAAEPLTYEQVIKWRVTTAQQAVSAMYAEMPKNDGLDTYRRQLGGSP